MKEAKKRSISRYVLVIEDELINDNCTWRLLCFRVCSAAHAHTWIACTYCNAVIMIEMNTAKWSTMPLPCIFPRIFRVWKCVIWSALLPSRAASLCLPAPVILGRMIVLPDHNLFAHRLASGAAWWWLPGAAGGAARAARAAWLAGWCIGT